MTEANNSNLMAEILDTALTPGYLVVKVPEKWEWVLAPITDEMTDTAEALPELVAELERSGYKFAGEPTDSTGEVELELL